MNLTRQPMHETCHKIYAGVASQLGNSQFEKIELMCSDFRESVFPPRLGLPGRWTRIDCQSDSNIAMAAKEIMNAENVANCYVADVQNNRVLLRSFVNEAPLVAPHLRVRQDISDSLLWIIPVETKADLLNVLTSLRDSHVPMLDVPAGWPPAAVFQQLRDDGQISGPFIAVTFAGKDSPVIEYNR